MTRKVENVAFTCAVCGRDVLPISRGTIRDHCPHCLCSLHVDIVPGDRACDCHGVLRPVSTDYCGKKGHILVYRCDRCGVTKRNRAAKDDNFDLILELQAAAARDLLP